jgi:Lrp/AsnC family leucine-responsive transcriptional regulator
MIAGAFDYLLKVRTTDIEAYRRVLGESISNLPHVANSSTHVTMEAVKEGTGDFLSFEAVPD